MQSRYCDIGDSSVVWGFRPAIWSSIFWMDEMMDRSHWLILRYVSESVIWGSRGSVESSKRGAEGPDSGSLIFSRIERSWEVSAVAIVVILVEIS